jgi:hypothetical protein
MLAARIGSDFRRLGTALALVAVIAAGAAALAPAAAHAAGCNNSWKTATSGSWYTASNWTKEAVPAAGEEVCITQSGTYSVTMTGGSGATVAALTIGGSSGSQLFEIASVCGANPTLTTTAGTSTNANGQIVFGSGSCSDSTTIAGPITNAGTITLAVGDNEGSRHLDGALTNTGTLQVNYNGSFEATKATLKNEGALKIAEGHKLTMESESSFVNAASGSITATGSGYLAVEPKTSFAEAGITSGTAPVLIRSGALSYTGAGASTIEARGATTLKGSLASGQNLQIQSVCGENTRVEATEALTNAGSTTLSSVSCGAYTILEAAGGTITNTGSITTQPGNKEGSRYLTGNIVNKGTLAIEYATDFEGNAAHSGKEATLTNEAALKLEGAVLKVQPTNTVANQSGEIAATAGGLLQEESGATFNQGGGKTAGTQPILLKYSALNYTGSGASTIVVRGTGTLSGNIAAGQNLAIVGVCGENTYEKAAANYTNAGTITLTSSSCGSTDSLETTAGSTLTNTGSITTQPGNKEGNRYLVGNLDNKGTLTIEYPTFYEGFTSGHEGTLTNEGNLKLENAVLKVQPTNTVANQSGEIAATAGGLLQEESGGTFIEAAGKTSSTKTVLLKASALDYTGKGASTITFRGAGTLGGEVAKGQTLIVASVCGENTSVTASSVKSLGTIRMTSESCGGSTRFELGAGVFKNAGKLYIEAGNHEGSREIEGELLNEKSLYLADYPLHVTGAFTQTKKGTFEPYITTDGEYGSLSASGAASLLGKLAIKQGKKFYPPEGQTFEILKSASTSGEFAKISGNKVKKSTLLFVAHYLANGVKLIVEP